MEANTRVLAFVVFTLATASQAGEHSSRATGSRPVAPENGASDKEVTEICGQVAKDIGGYTAFNNCTNFSLRFHQIAQQKSIGVRSITSHCPKESVGHAFNIVRLSTGKWHIVEPQSGKLYQPGFDEPTAPAPAALCEMMSTKLDDAGKCPCSSNVSMKPIPSNTNPHLACALNDDFRNRGKSIGNFRDCQTCCQDHNAYHLQNNHDLHEKWAKQCISSCRSHFFPEAQDTQDVSSPGRNDTLAIATGRSCVASASNFSFSSKLEQCRGCCLDGAQKGYYPLKQYSSCQAVCNAEFK